jgi:phage terminase large subunit-like protein
LILSLDKRALRGLIERALTALASDRWNWAGDRGKARAEQLPPTDDDWIVWLLLAGRGFGKTRTGAETVRALIEKGSIRRVALVGPTAADVRSVMVEGESGLLSVFPPSNPPLYEPSNHRILWRNGAIATCYSADEPRRLRGPQHDFAWIDELAAWRYPQEAWDMLMFGLRLGDRPRVVVTTTPKPIRLIRDLAAAPTTRVTRGSTFDNRKNLAASFVKSIVSKYEGTRLGRQELYAELLEQADGALWTRTAIEAARIAVEDQPELKRIVVAIDPAVTAGEHSDETGIVVAGIGTDGLAYVVRDASGRFSPNEWASRAINLYRLFGADRIVAETNNGGEMIELTLRTVMPAVSFKAVSASRGKQARAEPVAALYEQGRVRHVGGFPALEDQMCNWEPASGASSPDRVDALVWALTELVLEPRATGALDYLRDRVERQKPAA